MLKLTLTSRKIAIFLAVLFPVLIVLYITRNAVNIPYYDEWAWSELLVAFRSGKMPFNYLLGFHDEHRPIVARLVFLLTTLLAGHWDVLNELYVEVLCGLASLFALWRILKQTSTRTLGLWAVAFMSALYFSTSHSINWLMGFQLMWFLTVTFIILTLWLLTEFSNHIWALTLAILCGFLATFNIATGMAIWPLGLILMLALRKPVNGKAWRFWHMGVWVIAAAIAIVLYFNGYIRNTPKIDAARWQDMLKFALTYLGGPLALNRPNSFVMLTGALGLAIFVVSMAWALFANRGSSTRNAPSRIAPWVLLSGYGVISAVLTAIGRLSYGVEYGNAPHYVFIATQFWIGLIGLLATAITLNETKISAWAKPIKIMGGVVMALLIVAFVAGYLNVYNYGSKYMDGLHERMATARDYLLADYKTIPDSVLMLVHWDPKLARAEIEELYNLKDGVFLTNQADAKTLADLSVRQKTAGIALATSSQLIRFGEVVTLTAQNAKTKTGNDGVSLIFDVGASPTASLKMSLDDAPQNGKPFYLVLQTRYATSIDISWNAGGGFNDKNALNGVTPSYIRGDDRRYAINLPAGAQNVIINFHYSAKPAEPDILRMAIVAAQL